MIDLSKTYYIIRGIDGKVTAPHNSNGLYRSFSTAKAYQTQKIKFYKEARDHPANDDANRQAWDAMIKNIEGDDKIVPIKLVEVK